ncbi:MAG TPA: hypothetical protein VGX91_07800 [Candidatus Cybelea sp.]|jgi:hypothetical protein|nr:hypothetical protein [Candidatus Cybelea sp.]
MRYDVEVKPLAALLALLALVLSLAPPSTAQTAPPGTGNGTAAPRPWRPLIIVDPRSYLASPSPKPKHHATPHPRRLPPGRRRPLSRPTPETFERYDTSPSPRP